MLDRTELFYDKLEWNCKLDAMYADYHEEDDEDDEE